MNNFLVRNRFLPLFTNESYYSRSYMYNGAFSFNKRNFEMNNEGGGFQTVFYTVRYALCTWVCLLKILRHTFVYLLSGWPYWNTSQWKIYEIQPFFPKLLLDHAVALQFQKLVSSKKFHEGIFSKSFSESATSAWHRHQRGIFPDCTVSIILFLAGMNIIFEYSMQTRVPKFTTNNTTLPLLRAFMDDLNLMTTKVSGAQTLLFRCITALTWAGLEFRADKSCSIVIVKGRSMNTTPFSVSKTSVHPEVSSPIPSIHSRPIKFLGRIIDGSISDRNSSAELTDKLLAGLSVIDKSHFTGTQKLQILQHLLIPRIKWPLLIYTNFFSI